MNILHVQMGLLMVLDTLHARQKEATLLYWHTADKIPASHLTHQLLTLVFTLEQVVYWENHIVILLFR